MFLLGQCGFNKWNDLLQYLGLPMNYIRQMSDSMKVEVLAQWIANQQPSWEVLVSCVEKCDMMAANYMRRELNIAPPAGMLEEHQQNAYGM